MLKGEGSVSRNKRKIMSDAAEVFAGCGQVLDMLSIWFHVFHFLDFPGGSDGKGSACAARDPGLIRGLGRSSGRKKWLPTPIFLPGEFHG